MKKGLLLMLALVFSVYSSAYEYVNDKFCVYKIDVAKQTATLVNFYDGASSITIPSSFVYFGDTYIVDSIGYDDFKSSYLVGNEIHRRISSEYGYIDLKKIRSVIVELNLPSTIKGIGSDAFLDMSRLRKIIIPEGVRYYKSSWFCGNSRLETITFKGLLCYDYLKKKHKDDFFGEWYKVCLIDIPDPIATLDSLKNDLRKFSCPNLKSIEVLPLAAKLKEREKKQKEYNLYKGEMDNLYNSYSQQLKDTISIYETKLSEHPYYIKEDHFNSLSISKPAFKGDKPKEEYFKLTAKIKKDYNNQIKTCRENYNKLNKEMEQICKERQPMLYAKRYCSLHPDFSEKIDSMYYDYKCDYTRYEFVLAVLDNNVKGGNCQEKLWNQYGSLFKNKEAYLEEYEMSDDINQELFVRMKKYDELKSYIFSFRLSTKGLYDAASNVKFALKFQSLYKLVKSLEIPISTDLISKDQKAKKEYEKNGHYFMDADEFFDAYVRSTYKETLKTKKDEYKKHKKEKVNTTYNADNAEQEKYISELASKDENKAYIAYLFKIQRLNNSLASEFRKYFPWDEIQKLIQSYSVEQLQNMSKNHSEYFEKYEIEF